MYVEGEVAKRRESEVASGGKPREGLAEITKRLRSRLKDRSIDVALEIVAMSKNWDLWAAQADGKTFGKWLATFTRKPLSYFQELTTQLERHARLRTDMIGKVEPRVIYWCRNGTDDELVAGSVGVSAAFHRMGGVMLSTNQVRRIMPELVKPYFGNGKDREKQLMARIGRLIEQVRALGAEPVE